MYFIEFCPICSSDAGNITQAIMMPFVSVITKIWEPIRISKSDFYDLDEGVAYFTTYTVDCAKCGLVYAKHRFNESELDRLYGSYRGVEYNKIRGKYEPHYNKTDLYLKEKVAHLNNVTSLIKKYHCKIDSVLDWGGGEGLNTPCIDTAKIVACYDPSLQNKVKIIKNNSEQEFEGQCFDLVVCMHVLEHVNFPVSVLESAIESIAENGIVYIEVPLENCVNFLKGGLAAPGIKKHWHEHINCFSRTSFESMIEKLPLDILYLEQLDVSDNFRKFAVIQCVARINR